MGVADPIRKVRRAGERRKEIEARRRAVAGERRKIEAREQRKFLTFKMHGSEQVVLLDMFIKNDT